MIIHEIIINNILRCYTMIGKLRYPMLCIYNRFTNNIPIGFFVCTWIIWTIIRKLISPNNI